MSLAVDVDVDVTASDVEWVFGALGTWDCCYLWSARGRTPNYPEVHDRLTGSVPRQWSLRDAQGAPVGLLQVFDVKERHGFGHLSLLLDPGATEAIGDLVRRFVTTSLAELGLCKLCFSCVDGELDPRRYLGDAVEQVGRLTEHERQGTSAYADLLMYEVWPDGADA